MPVVSKPGKTHLPQIFADERRRTQTEGLSREFTRMNTNDWGSDPGFAAFRVDSRLSDFPICVTLRESAAIRLGLPITRDHPIKVSCGTAT
jgi:hypothetical protein